MANRINRRAFLKIASATIASGLPASQAAAQSSNTCIPYGSGSYDVGRYSVACGPLGVGMNGMAASKPRFWLHSAIIVASTATLLTVRQAAPKQP